VSTQSPERAIALPTKKSSAKKAEVRAKPVDLRAPLPPTPANLSASLSEVQAALAELQAPKPQKPSDGKPADGSQKPGPQRPGDLVQVMVHLIMAEGLPCGYGQEAVRRIEHAFVDRNEFRVTEAYEVAELLEDLQIPDLFDRCHVMRDAVAQVYNDQNSVSLEFLRGAAVGDRQSFFNRVPAIAPRLARQIVHVVSFEEAIFGEKPGPRILQRLGLESGGEEFCGRLRELLVDFGHVPFKVGPDAGPRDLAAKPHLTPVLCPGCILLRLAPSGKK